MGSSKNVSLRLVQHDQAAGHGSHEDLRRGKGRGGKGGVGKREEGGLLFRV